ncbi:hypothetical protein Tco_0009181 [Tanacetum coccineum]
MSAGKIIHRGIYSLTETLRAPPKSLGKVVRERIPGELSPSTYPGRHVARDEFPQRQVVRERREISLGLCFIVIIQLLLVSRTVIVRQELDYILTRSICSFVSELRKKLCNRVHSTAHDMLADPMTKGLPPKVFEDHVSKMGLLKDLV